MSWLLLAVALVLSGKPRTAVDRRREGARASLRTLQLVVVVTTIVVAFAALGVPGGAVGSVLLAPVSHVVVRRLHARPARARADPQLALCLDLVAVALRAGQPLSAALVLSAPAATVAGPALLRVAGLLRIGASPEQAWDALADDPVLGTVAAAGRRSAESGIRLAEAFEQRAGELRADAAATAQARAHRVEVLVAAPLGLCFLPAFVCLGIVPTVIGIAGSVLGS